MKRGGVVKRRADGGSAGWSSKPIYGSESDEQSAPMPSPRKGQDSDADHSWASKSIKGLNESLGADRRKMVPEEEGYAKAPRKSGGRVKKG
tara:strand:+ start:184 stop:456 length:273 start_codon:yes stop_codon:yes gene_type:complete